MARRGHDSLPQPPSQNKTERTQSQPCCQHLIRRFPAENRYSTTYTLGGCPPNKSFSFMFRQTRDQSTYYNKRSVKYSTYTCTRAGPLQTEEWSTIGRSSHFRHERAHTPCLLVQNKLPSPYHTEGIWVLAFLLTSTYILYKLTARLHSTQNSKLLQLGLNSKQ